MSDIAIRVENLGKQYRIGALQKAGGRHTYKSLRDSIADAASLPLRAARRVVGQGEPAGNGHDETFWALKDVSFDIKHGEIVGVIGRNGAGKSTLLKLLSRITEPTTGRVEIHGRVGSLLEVGTGFHPELSGRDNVYMNGAILGMKRSEIARQFDEIVAFAGVDKFIDTPVKHYSSGMYLRLAFAVAAHLQTEILIVDEVLAVGDAAFQKKCLSKMQDVSKTGRTVLFVSHNLPAVENLCSSGILLRSGQVSMSGPSVSVISEYINDSRLNSGEDSIENLPRTGTGRVKVAECWLEDDRGMRANSFRVGQRITIALAYHAERHVRNVDVGVSLHTLSDQRLCVHYSSYVGQHFSDIQNQGTFRTELIRVPITAGNYYIAARILENGLEADWPRCPVARFEVVPADFYGTGSTGFTDDRVFLTDSKWTLDAGYITSEEARPH